MVIQRDTAHNLVAGVAALGDEIALSVDGERIGNTTIVGDSLRFSLALPSIPASPLSSPSMISIDDLTTNETIELQDVLFGDVFLCSGQSNMQFCVNQSLGGVDIAKESGDYGDGLRMLYVNMTYSEDETDTLGPVTGWSRSSPEFVAGPDFTLFSSVCYNSALATYKSLNESVAIGAITSVWGGTPVAAWSSPRALAKCPNAKDLHDVGLPQTNQSWLWNGMIAPLLQTAQFKSVLWYQGEYEGEDDAAEQMACQFPAMIEDWRLEASRGGDNDDMVLPFLFAQLGPGDPNTPSKDSGYCGVRQSQSSVVSLLPATGMATAFDLGDPLTPWPNHSRRKAELAERFSLLIRSVVYGDESVVSTGPLVATIVPSSSNEEEEEATTIITTTPTVADAATMSTFVVTYDRGGLALLQTPTFGGDAVTTNYTVCSVDAAALQFEATQDAGVTWVAASAVEVVGDDEVHVHLPTAAAALDGDNTVGVFTQMRYAWWDAPLCAVYGPELLPSTPWVADIVQ
jgi:sialate O-acetylesterase